VKATNTVFHEVGSAGIEHHSVLILPVVE